MSTSLTRLNFSYVIMEVFNYLSYYLIYNYILTFYVLLNAFISVAEFVLLCQKISKKVNRGI
jgi:hypothetical protein